MLSDDRLCGNKHERVLNELIPACLMFGMLEGIGPQVKKEI